MTRYEFEARQLIGNWLAKKKIKPVVMRHVYPRCYVIGYAAPMALIVTRPWVDSEPHMSSFNKENPLEVVRCFDETLRPGDWCATAYVSTESSGQPVAVAWKAKT